MNKQQTYDVCEYFSYRTKCLHIGKKIMKDLVNDLDLSNSCIGRKLDASKIIEKAKKVNKKYCNPCTAFKDCRG